VQAALDQKASYIITKNSTNVGKRNEIKAQKV
jgi:hypothetical protein